MGHPKFNRSDFLAAALTIAAERGPAAVTIASITTLLRAPTGSFYHRFASRNVLLGALWLRTVVAFQQGGSAAIDAGDGLRAALHTPSWVREHLEEARLLLLYDRNDFVQGEWPDELREGVGELTRAVEGGAKRRALVISPLEGREDFRRAQFFLAEVPVAAVRQYLVR